MDNSIHLDHLCAVSHLFQAVDAPLAQRRIEPARQFERRVYREVARITNDKQIRTRLERVNRSRCQRHGGKISFAIDLQYGDVGSGTGLAYLENPAGPKVGLRVPRPFVIARQSYRFGRPRIQYPVAEILIGISSNHRILGLAGHLMARQQSPDEFV